MLHIATLAVFSVTSPEPVVHPAIIRYRAFQLHIATKPFILIAHGKILYSFKSTC